MDEKAQAEGERRVRDQLIKPLERIGLAKPTTLKVADFETMKRELCQKLAYMTNDGLAALREWVEAHPGGKDGDRFPIALKILKQARQIEQPQGGPSPLCTKVFAHALGADALAKGYAPELLKYVKAAREWPGRWTMGQVQREAAEPTRRLANIEMLLARGDAVSPEDMAFRDKRRALIRQCDEIREQGRKASAA